jgi:hypothetical protein
MYNLSIALYWSKLVALLLGLANALEVIPGNPLSSVILFLLFQELSELFMIVHIKGSTNNGTDSK